MSSLVRVSRPRHVPIEEFTFCDQCGAFATHSTYDQVETPAPAGEWREFRQDQKRSGCRHHPAIAMCTYLDGRVLRVSECKPEKVPNQLPETRS